MFKPKKQHGRIPQRLFGQENILQKPVACEHVTPEGKRRKHFGRRGKEDQKRLTYQI